LTLATDDTALTELLTTLGISYAGAASFLLSGDAGGASLSSFVRSGVFQGALTWAADDYTVDLYSYSTGVFIGTFPITGGAVQVTGVDLSSRTLGTHTLLFVGNQSGAIVPLRITLTAAQPNPATPPTAAKPNPATPPTAARPNPTPPTVVTDSTQPLVIEVASGAEGAGVDYSKLLTGGAGTIPQTTFVTSDGVTVKIPQTRITSDDPSWDGVIQPPTVVPNSSVTIPAESGTTVTLATAIQVGAGTIGLTFDEGVRLLLPGESGKLVGFVHDGTFSQITTKCSADPQTAGDALVAGGDCYISVGADIVIWSKHFTTFVAYSSVAAPAPAPAPAAPDATGPDATGPDATGPDATGPDATSPALWVGGALLLVLVLGSALLVARRRKALAGVS